MNHHPETRERISYAPITAAEQQQARYAAADARQRKLERQRAEQQATAVAMDAEVIAEWARRLADLAARIPNARTDAGRELVGRLRVRLGIVANDIELAGFGTEKK